jgi:hypothetical protein
MNKQSTQHVSLHERNRLPGRCVVQEGPHVIDKLDFLVRFWELKARHATLGQPLAPNEQLELLSLMQLVTHDFKVPKAGPIARTRHAMPAQLIGDGWIFPVEVRSVSAAALIVAGASYIPAGSRVVVRAADAVSGVEYTLPCSVAWVHAGAPYTMALVVDGIPTRNDFSTPTDAPMRSTLSMGRHERLVG